MKPTVLYDPVPRSTEDIFRPDVYKNLCDEFKVLERGDRVADEFYAEHLPTADFIVGQPPLPTEIIKTAKQLKALINVESNFLQNMDYQYCFRNQIHVLTVSPVFAQAVAELALGLTLALARDIPKAHGDFVNGDESYGLEANQNSTLINRCKLGFIGFGDLGRAILKSFSGFSPVVSVYDPWLSDELLCREGLQVASLVEVLQDSDVVMVVASVTADNAGMLQAKHFAKMKQNALFVLMSRAEVVDFDAMLDACSSGHIRAATDVFPIEPLPQKHRARTTPNVILSAHRAGALESALFEIGDRTLADLRLMAKGLPPQNCKRAEHELVGKVRSKPIDKS
ncbi:MAG: NAD(P)-dependent oxidoreductase [Granulosicoccaceae bacterium]